MESTPARPQHRLDPYVDRYAARTAGMTASEIRALFAVASRPEVVSLAGGMPNISGLPLDVVGRAIGEIYPTTHFIIASRGAFSKGLGFADLGMAFAALAAAVPIILGLSALLLRKQAK